VATIVVNKQLRYMMSGAVGFNKDHVISIERTDLLEDQTKSFENELAKIPVFKRSVVELRCQDSRTFLELLINRWALRNQ
jgi:hypothetical protein